MNMTDGIDKIWGKKKLIKKKSFRIKM